MGIGDVPLGYGVGLAASALLDLPSGPVVVRTLAACAVGAALALQPAGAAVERVLD